MKWNTALSGKKIRAGKHCSYQSIGAVKFSHPSSATCPDTRPLLLTLLYCVFLVSHRKNPENTKADREEKSQFFYLKHKTKIFRSTFKDAFKEIIESALKLLLVFYEKND